LEIAKRQKRKTVRERYIRKVDGKTDRKTPVTNNKLVVRQR